MNQDIKKKKTFQKYLPVLKNAWFENINHSKPEHFHKYFNEDIFNQFLLSAEKFKTPQYLLDVDSLKSRGKFFIDTFQKNIPNSEFFYACKCNDFPYVLKSLKSLGFNADVAGLLELKVALKLGIKKIMFTSPSKTEEELILSIKNRDKVIINIDNKDEIILLKDIIKKLKLKNNDIVKISIRLNPVRSVMGSWSKFGIELQELKNIIDNIFDDSEESKKIKLEGLHFHCSWNKTPDKYIENIEALGDYLYKNRNDIQIKKIIENIKFLDIGGGFFPENTAIIDKIQDKGILIDLISEITNDTKIYDELKKEIGFDQFEIYIRKVNKLKIFSEKISKILDKKIFSLFNKNNLNIFLEPGRFIVTHSTSILTKVTAIKGDNVIVDAGINMIGGYRFEEHSYAPIVNISGFSKEYHKSIIYGSLCDPSDLFGYHYYGKKLKKGDIIAILHQGAYTNAMAWHFIRPLPKYIILEKKKLSIGREEETFKQKYGNSKF